jgi:hypothetical protein
MAMRFTLTRVVPGVVAFAGLFGAALGLDYGLHRVGLVSIGRYLGVAGTLLVAVSFLYSLRKRRVIRVGAPQVLLQAHEVLGWIGAVMILVHGGIHFNAPLPWLAMLAMVIVVASGLTGKYLLQDARQRLREKEQELRAAGSAPADVEKAVFGQALLVDTMKQWRRVHLPLTMVFLGLAAVHVVATLVLWRW